MFMQTVGRRAAYACGALAVQHDPRGGHVVARAGKAKGVRQVEILWRCDLAPMVAGRLDSNETWDARAPAAGQACSTHLQSARCVKGSPDEHRLARPMSRVCVRNIVRRPQGAYRAAMTRPDQHHAWMREFRPQAGKASHLPAGP